MSTDLEPAGNESKNDSGQSNKSLLEYWQAKSTSFSARILQRVVGGPFAGFLLKKPTNRDVLMIAATVVGACDEKIAELEGEREFWTRVSSFANKPLILPATSATPSGGPDKDGPTPEEANFFLRYLTLRNFLAVAFIIITSVAGLIAWTTSNFKERAEARALEVKELKDERDDLRNKLNAEKDNDKKLAVGLADKTRQADDLSHQVTDLSGAKRALDDKVGKMQKEIEGLKVKLAGLGETPPK